MIKINSYDVDIYIPYIYFPDATIILRKHRDLSEIEAIVYSFICENEIKSKQVLPTLFDSFNIESSKWSEFFKEIINNSIKNKEIITDIEQLDDNTLFGELVLHKSIISNIRNHKFIGLDSKDIERKVIFNKAIYDSISTNVNQYILNKELFNVDNLDINFGENLYHIDEINSILLDKFQEDVDSSSRNELEIIKSTGLKNYLIRFNKIKSHLDIYINNSITIDSNDKSTNAILNKFNEKNISNLIIRSIMDNFKIENDFFNFFVKDYLNNVSVINFMEYPSILEQVKKIKLEFKLDKNLLIEDGYLFDIFYSKMKTFVLDIETENMVILCKEKIENCYKLVIDEISKNNNKIIKLLDNLNDIDKIKVIEYMENNMEVYWNDISFRNYLVDNILIKNKLNKNKILPILISNSVNFEDYKKILLNNKNSFTDFINEVNKTNNDQNNPLIDKKILYTLDFLNIDFLKINYSGIKNNFIEKIYNEFTLCKNFVEKKVFNKDVDNIFLKTKKFINSLNSNLLNNSFDEIFNEWETLKIVKKDDLLKEFSLKFKILQETLEEFSLNNNIQNFENVIKSKALKDEFAKIRIYRNKLTHNEKISEYSYEKLECDIKLINNHVLWLKNNKDLLYNSIEKEKNIKYEP